MVVLNAIEYLTARETKIFNTLGKTGAIATVHSYLTDTLLDAASLATAEATDYTNTALTTPSRLTNVIQHTVKKYEVSRTQNQIAHFHGQNELQRQTQKALKDWSNSVEFDLVRSTLVSGVSGATPKLSGIIEATSKSSNHTSHTSGTVWSATILDGLMKDSYDNSNGDVATDIFMGSYLRSITDTFTQKTNVVVNNAAGQTTIVRTVSSFQTALGTVQLHTHRYVQQSGDATGRVLAIRPEKLKVAFLKKPFIDTDLARSGNYDPRAVAGSWTLEVHNQDSCFFSDGFLKG